jgi:uncharacterized protein YndB with AHSA1/START domain
MKTQLGELRGSRSPRSDGGRVGRRLLWVGALALAVAAIVLAAGWFLPADYHVDAEIVIPRPAERVWRGFVQPDRWREWLQGVRSVTVISDVRDGVGSRRRVVSILPGGRELVSEIEVTEWEDGARYAHRHLNDSLDGWTLPVSDGRVEVDLEPVADQACRLRIKASFRADGPLVRWWAFVVAKPLADKALSERLDDLSSRIRNASPDS